MTYKKQPRPDAPTMFQANVCTICALPMAPETERVTLIGEYDAHPECVKE